MNHPARVTHPLLREGERGGGKWKKISWDDAYNHIERRLKEMQQPVWI
jgi:thiosulfate reductase/polysulfide reductase chain A